MDTQIKLTSAEKYNSMESAMFTRNILDEVDDGTIIVISGSLEPTKESHLIEHTMYNIEPDGDFSGLFIKSIGEDKQENNSGLLGKVLNRDDDTDGGEMQIIARSGAIEAEGGESEIIAKISDIQE